MDRGHAPGAAHRNFLELFELGWNWSIWVFWKPDEKSQLTKYEFWEHPPCSCWECQAGSPTLDPNKRPKYIPGQTTGDTDSQPLPYRAPSPDFDPQLEGFYSNGGEDCMTIVKKRGHLVLTVQKIPSNLSLSLAYPRQFSLP